MGNAVYSKMLQLTLYELLLPSNLLLVLFASARSFCSQLASHLDVCILLMCFVISPFFFDL